MPSSTTSAALGRSCSTGMLEGPMAGCLCPKAGLFALVPEDNTVESSGMLGVAAFFSPASPIGVEVSGGKFSRSEVPLSCFSSSPSFFAGLANRLGDTDFWGRLCAVDPLDLGLDQALPDPGSWVLLGDLDSGLAGEDVKELSSLR